MGSSLGEGKFLRGIARGWLVNFGYLLFECARHIILTLERATLLPQGLPIHLANESLSVQNQPPLGTAIGVSYLNLIIPLLSTISTAFFFSAAAVYLIPATASPAAARRIEKIAIALPVVVFSLMLFGMIFELTEVLWISIFISVLSNAYTLVILGRALSRLTRGTLKNKPLLAAAIKWPLFLYALLQLAYFVDWRPVVDAPRGHDVGLASALGFSLAFLFKFLHLGAVISGYTGIRMANLRDLENERALIGQQRRFISRMAHEMVTPAAELHMHFNMFMVALKTGQPTVQEAAAISDVVNRLLAIVRGAHSLVELEEGRMEALIKGSIRDVPIERAMKVNLNSIMHSSLMAVRATFDDQDFAEKISVETQYAAEPEVIGYRFLLMQAIINIIKNSFEALPRGGKMRLTTKRLRNRSTRITEHVVVSIYDNGPGIAKTVIDMVMIDGFSTKGLGSERGHGLAIAKQVIEIHGGEIEVSADDTAGGTLITVKLPVSGVTKEL